MGAEKTVLEYTKNRVKTTSMAIAACLAVLAAGCGAHTMTSWCAIAPS